MGLVAALGGDHPFGEQPIGALAGGGGQIGRRLRSKPSRADRSYILAPCAFDGDRLERAGTVERGLRLLPAIGDLGRGQGGEHLSATDAVALIGAQLFDARQRLGGDVDLVGLDLALQRLGRGTAGEPQPFRNQSSPMDHRTGA